MQLNPTSVALENRMDLRIQKTLENIEQQFLSLRTKSPLNRIQVNELCKSARINKSTFYRHYTDVFDLSDKIENKTIDEVMQDFTAIGDLFIQPENFINGLLDSIQRHNPKILTLFGDRIDVFSKKIEERIKEHYLTSSSNSPQADIVMSFLIGGAAHVFLTPDFDFKTSTQTIATLLRNFPIDRF